METSFELFGLTGYRLGLWAAAGTLILFFAMMLLARKRNVQPTSVCWLTIAGMALGIVFARLLYCLVNLADFVEAYENPWLMLRFFDGGLSLSGLLLGLLLAVPLTACITREKAAELMDILFVPVGLLFAALYLGQQDSGLGIGKIAEEGAMTSLFPWLFLCERMGVNVEYRMLVYLYQAILSAVIAIALIAVYLRVQKKAGFRAGETGLLALALYGCAMVVLESLRDDGHMQLIFLRIGQVTAALLPIVSAIVLNSRHRRYSAQKAGMTAAVVLAVILFIAGIAILEFALDGRLGLGEATPLHFYLVMILLSVVMATLNIILYRRLLKLRGQSEA
ncbi:MAG: prolipoprotein diacylglyceryl transferase [Clostridia bacterium]|nr:prolipoprotein diacylglyceryl transferase [Clostridia bacterium]